MSKNVISCFVQSKMPNDGAMTGTAKVLWAMTWLLLYKADDQIFLTFFLYFLTTRSLFKSPLYPTDSSCPRYLYSSSSLSSPDFQSINFYWCIPTFPLSANNWVAVRRTYVFTLQEVEKNLPDIAKSRDASMDNKKQHSFLF